MKNPFSLLQCKSKIAFYLCILILTFYALPVQASVVFNEDFESGIGSWTIDNEVWEVGSPTSEPGSSYGGTQCAGTVLDLIQEWFYN